LSGGAKQIMQEIFRKNFVGKLENEFQEKFIAMARDDATRAELYRKYDADSLSFSGKYVAADLFKDMFEDYSLDKNTRFFLNAPLHNTATVLAADFLENRMRANQERKDILFLTGSPGSGKTTALLAGRIFPRFASLIFEGKADNSEAFKQKVRAALESNLVPKIIAVKNTPQECLKNSIARYEHYGRGTTVNIISQFHANYFDWLDALRAEFGNDLQFALFDFSERSDYRYVGGWENLELLKSNGGQDDIRKMLLASLEAMHNGGLVSDAAYRQAIGQIEEFRGVMGKTRDSREK
jgi:hypothetical protein